MKRILFFSSLCKPKAILEMTLPSWLGMKMDGFEIDFIFYNDNKETAAFEYTTRFGKEQERVTVIDDWFTGASSYDKHHWTHAAVDRVIHIKNKAIEIALEKDYDALFLVDADLVLHPQTLNHLVSLNKDFVFEIFWTVFTDQLFAKPNCWDVHSWDYHNAESILKLKEPGTYQVGAGGACTLLTKDALLKGLTFEKIKNIPYGGEDRHICTRAEVLGIDIYVDTYLPAFHVYDTTLISRALDWVQSGCSRDYFDSWLDSTWRSYVIEYLKPPVIIVPKNSLDKFKKALYKAKRAYVNYMRYH